MSIHEQRRRRLATACIIAVVVLAGIVLQGQTPQPAPKDPLGRDTPRGTVLGFMDAAREGNSAAAILYLNTQLREQAASALAHQLFVVLDSRLPARLITLSDHPEGSLANPAKPNQDVVGTIQLADGPLEITVERLIRNTPQPVWLFSRATLDAIPEAYGQIHLVSADRYLPELLTRPRLGGIRLFQWLALLLIPFAYRALEVIGSALRPAFGFLRRRSAWADWWLSLSPGPIRLLLVCVSIGWLVSLLTLPFPERRFWIVVDAILAVVALSWLMLRLTASAEQSIRRQLSATTVGEITAMLRLARRTADLLVLAAALLVILRVFGLDPTAALAGLGIGGIALALAAQKTLENVVGGLSIVFDKAVRVGDTVKLAETVGTVEFIGLRSTRIRTVDRTVVSVPNGQIANANIETLSARDRFRFYHVVGLGYETTTSQMVAVLEGIRRLLADRADVDPEEIRARFFRLGPFSLDIEIFAYVNARGWDAFLEVQQELLLGVLQIIGQRGAIIAFPSQTLYLAGASGIAGMGPGPRTATATLSSAIPTTSAADGPPSHEPSDGKSASATARLPVSHGPHRDGCTASQIDAHGAGATIKSEPSRSGLRATD